MGKINILIYDKEELSAGLMQILIKGHSEFNVNEVKGIEPNILDILENHQIDIFFLVALHSKKSSIQTIKQITNTCPSLKIILISAMPESSYIKECLLAGALGFASNFTESYEIIDAIKTVAGGGIYLCKEAVNALIQLKEDLNGVDGTNNLSFTKREKEIFQLILKGYSTKKIADELYLSIRTVETHRKNILRKYKEKNFVSLMKSVMEQNKIRIMDLV